MSEDEYWNSNGEYESDGDESLPSSFMSGEDVADETNVILIPPYRLNIELILNNFLEQCSLAKTKEELYCLLEALWREASEHGSLTERRARLQMDIDMLKHNISAMEI